MKNNYSYTQEDSSDKNRRKKKKAHYEALLKLFTESFQDVSQFYHLFSFQYKHFDFSNIS